MRRASLDHLARERLRHGEALATARRRHRGQDAALARLAKATAALLRAELAAAKGRRASPPAATPLFGEL